MKGRGYILKGVVVALLCASFSAGCRTVQKPFPGEPEVMEINFAVGRIVRVNSEHSYVVLQCTSLPTAGEEATVYRDEQAVGRLRITGPVRMPFAVADILEGLPAAGDQVRVVRIRSAESMDGGVQ